MEGYSANVLALAGGVGGAKLALGLARLLPPEQLTIVVNTGDDETFHGLHVSPDLDTMLYTLAGISNEETGWGIEGETFHALGMLSRYGADTWFNLGDRDLATHIRRTQLLQGGWTLSEVMDELCQRLGVKHSIVPMSDGPVRTFLGTDLGELPMQDYFVRRRSEPAVNYVQYLGAAESAPSRRFATALDQADMIVLCPSNPLLSTGPILALPGVREKLAAMNEGTAAARMRVAVSPLIGGQAVRGPAAKIMAELRLEPTCLGVARLYRDICDVILIDEQDKDEIPAINELGIRAMAAPIYMESEEDKITLARLILDLGGSFQNGG